MPKLLAVPNIDKYAYLIREQRKVHSFLLLHSALLFNFAKLFSLILGCSVLVVLVCSLRS